MSHVSTQHPAVVLRSQYVHVRALLAIAMVAVVSLTVAVVILAARNTTATTAAAPHQAQIRYDGGPEEGNPGTVVPGH